MGFITIFHHHLGEYVLDVFPVHMDYTPEKLTNVNGTPTMDESM